MLVGEAGWCGGGASADWLLQEQQGHVTVEGYRLEEGVHEDLLHLDQLLARVGKLLVKVSWEGGGATRVT